jgi:hypothetical protein
MNRDLHDIDELFRSALEGNEETPSAGVKENLDAALDKKDAEKYKKRFILWKRAALLLLLLLSGFVLYESGLIKKDGDYTSTKSGLETDKISGNKRETINNNSSGNINTDKIVANQPASENGDAVVQQNQQGITPVPETSFKGSNKTIIIKNNWPDKPFSLFNKKQDPLFSILSSQPDKKTTAVSNDDDYLQTTRQGIEPLDERISIAKVAGQLVKNISLLPLITVSSSPLKTTAASDSKKKKANPFTPFWMATAFASYDQAGYKLDSDEPSAISSIKFREAHEPSFSVGLLFTRQLTPRFSLQSGIVYRNTAIGMKPQKTYAFQDPTGDVAYKYITSSGYAFIKPGFGPHPTIGDSLTTAEAKHTLENISVPLLARYTVGNKKITITPGAGVEANFITKANLEVDIEDPFNREIVVVRKLSGTKSFYWSFVADAEIKYKVNQKLSINIRPVYRTAISPITKNNVVETFPHSFGIGAGVTIKL